MYSIKNKSSGLRNARKEQIFQQEKLIEQRKKEIEQKLMMKNSNEEANASSEPQTGTSKSQTTDEKEVKSEEDEEKSSANKFKNDGSFFAQFMAMQQQKAKENKEDDENDIRKSPEITNESDSKCPIKVKLNTQSPQTSSKLKVVNQPDSSTVNLFNEDELQDDPDSVSPPEDKSVRLAIEKTAISVVMNGDHAQETMKESMKDNQHYNWLNHKDSSFYKYFLVRTQELKEAKSRAQNEGLLELNQTLDPKNEKLKRERKSRWSDEKVDLNQNTFMYFQDQGLLQYAIQVYGKTDLTGDQWKQLEDQRKMKLLFEMLQNKQNERKRLANARKVKYDYDSDEDVEDGTWEHKRRKLEMEKTKTWAEELTERASGKHHIGDFMPPEELEKFMENWEAIKEGEKLDTSDYSDSKLSSDSLGFKMLQKLGWSEGQGLGANCSGVTTPINQNASGTSNAGLGLARPDELKEGDDEYEAYRKRMMLAYRFRPNPLNNPRRSYY